MSENGSKKAAKPKAKKKSSRRPPVSAAGASPPGRRASSEAKLENLLSEAAKLIAEHGYDNTSIRDVARATGYSLAGMYYYFDSKEDLLYQIQRNAFSALLAAQENAVATVDSPEDKLEAIVHSYLAFFTSHTSEMKICTYEFESLKGDTYESVRVIRHRLYELMAGIVAGLMNCSPTAARDSRTVRHHTLFVYGILNWLFMWFDPERDGATRGLGDEIVAMIRGGLPIKSGKK